jgi:DNA-directed RNA polymerase specialized sigma24 family protein
MQTASNERLRRYCSYILTDLTNGKQYGGQTGQKPKRRFGQHKRDGLRGKGALIGQAIREHGPENFVFSVIREGLTKKEADYEERTIVRTFLLRDPEFGYNVSRGGSGEGTKKRRYVDDRAVAEAYLSGLSTTEVGKRFGVDSSTIGLWLHDMGVEVRKAAPKKKAVSDEEVVSMYTGGLSTIQIAEKVGLSPATIQNRLKSSKVPIRSVGGSLAENQRIVDLYQQGLSLNEVGLRVGITGGAIKGRLLKMGIKPKPPGSWVKRKDVVDERAIELYQCGQNCRQIGLELGCSEGTIHTRLEQAGIKLRPRGTRHPKIVV